MSAGKSFKFITFSTLIHSGCVLALLTSPFVAQLTPLPLGTGHDSSLEMMAEAPLGEQTEVAAPVVDSPKMAEPKVEEAVTEQKVPVAAEKKVAKKTEPKAKSEKAKTAAKIATELPPKEAVTEVTEEAPDMPAVALVPASDRAEQLKDEQIEQLDPEVADISEDLSDVNSLADTAVETEEIDNSAAEALAEAEALDAEEEKAFSTALENETATDTDLPEKTETAAAVVSSPSTSASGSGEQSGAAEAFGTSQGVRSYENLSQAPGNKPPAYPSQARMQRQEGQVILQYFVTAKGLVSNMKLVKSSGYVVLDKEAMTAVSQYKYQPGQEGWTVHPITFSLNGPEERAGGRLRTSMR